MPALQQPINDANAKFEKAASEVSELEAEVAKLQTQRSELVVEEAAETEAATGSGAAQAEWRRADNLLRSCKELCADKPLQAKMAELEAHLQQLPKAAPVQQKQPDEMVLDEDDERALVRVAEETFTAKKVEEGEVRVVDTQLAGKDKADFKRKLKQQLQEQVSGMVRKQLKKQRR